MHSVEIERRLRLPAPEEPSILPALRLPELPPSASLEGARPRIRLGGAFGPLGPASPRLALALLAILGLLVGAIVSGALRLDFIKSLLDPNAVFHGRGISLTYPNGWVPLTSGDRFGTSAATTALIVSSTGVAGCAPEDLGPPSDIGVARPSLLPDAVETTVDAAEAPPDATLDDRMLACVVGKPMATGEIRLVVSRGVPQSVGVGPIEPFDPSAWYGPGATSIIAYGYVPGAYDGWDRTIDGMPAKLVVTTVSPIPGAAEVRTWAVYEPGRVDDPWFVRLTLAGPDLKAARTRADAIAQSLRFDTPVASLDAARRDRSLAKVIDDLDRDTRKAPGTELYGCFPRAPGERTAVLRDGPFGPLPDPVTVTCRTSVNETTLGAWQAHLTVAWQGGDEHPLGEFIRTFLFDESGSPLIFAPPDEAAERSFPGLSAPLPGKLSGPLVVPIGSFVEVVPPGISQMGEATQAVYQQPATEFLEQMLTSEVSAGRHMYVLDGPVAHEGFAWYLVETQSGWLTSDIGWVPVVEAGRPLVRVIAPACPANELDVSELLRLIPAERLACFDGSEITLKPSMAAVVGEDAAMPPLLAPDSRWQLFGRAGPSGLDGPIRVALASSLSSLPIDDWLAVKGHFDDPAAETCRDQPALDWAAAIPPEIRVLRCRETFVVTSFTLSAGPSS